MLNVETIVRIHMEAMHDDLAKFLAGQRAVGDCDGDGGAQFAAEVIRCVSEGLMFPSEYVDWWGEEVCP